ncbi:kinase-like domain-containing protein, partial [Paraphoma chrysanthemicola]
TSYTDKDITDIARLLEETRRTSWGKIPRIYTVLRLIGQIPFIESFLDEGLNDMWLPFKMSQLPSTMSGTARNRFVECQNMVLTKAMNLENTAIKRHTHFGKGEELPLDIGEELGQGGYGSVHQAYSPLSGRTYALKRFRRAKQNAREIESFMTELQILQRINHHHCIELVASYTDSKFFGLLMAPVADCNLSAFYGHVASNEANKKILRTFFGCLAHALQFLHNSKVRHRDIKPENILVKGSAVYLADFAISLDWESLTRSTTTADSAKSWTYCAPEVASHQKRNSSSDVWSLGCVFLEMAIVLEGFTTQELREAMCAHSGRCRFYENLEVCTEWIGRLDNQEDNSNNQILSCIR